MKNQTIFINSRGESLNRKAFRYLAYGHVVLQPLVLNKKVMQDNKTKNTQPQPMPQALIDGINKFMLWDEPDKLKFRLFNILHHAMAAPTADNLTHVDRAEMFDDIKCIYDLIDVINITHTQQTNKN